MSLPEGIHIWQASLLQDEISLHDLEKTLSPEEHRRAQSYIQQTDCQAFIVRRGILRSILAQYLNCAHQDIVFGTLRNGKPHLKSPQPDCNLFFNLSYSHQRVIYAFTSTYEVGIDLEYIHPISDMEEISARFFSTAEQRLLSHLPKEQKHILFFQLWTRKEALLKACGTGIPILSEQIEVLQTSTIPNHPFALSKSCDPSTSWRILDLPLSTPEYMAALAVETTSSPPTPQSIFDWHHPI